MNKKNKTFEEAVSELEQLINEVENDSLPLEKMIDKVTEGAKLIRLCQSKLNVMNGKVEMLFKDDGAAGEFQEFDPDNDRSRAAGIATPSPAPAAASQAAPPESGSRQDDLPF
ncbi:MAG: exodeoxyribonuclease VII small subunit [Lentisphaerae bacterium]|nr:exodeoxyribonuclease VII small subunit [Lentisphaerota bacterium]